MAQAEINRMFDCQVAIKNDPRIDELIQEKARLIKPVQRNDLRFKLNKKKEQKALIPPAEIKEEPYDGGHFNSFYYAIKKEENKDFIKKESSFNPITLSNYIVKKPAKSVNVSLYPPLPAQATPICTKSSTVFSTEQPAKTAFASSFTAPKIAKSTTTTVTVSTSTEIKNSVLPTTLSPKKSLKSPSSIKAKKTFFPADGKPKDVPIIINQGVKSLSTPIKTASKKPKKPRTPPKDRKNRILKKNLSVNKTVSDISTAQQHDTKNKKLTTEKDVGKIRDDSETIKKKSTEPLIFVNKDSNLQSAKKPEGKNKNILDSSSNTGQLNEEDLLDYEDNLSIVTDLNDMNEDELLNDDEDHNTVSKSNETSQENPIDFLTEKESTRQNQFDSFVDKDIHDEDDVMSIAATENEFNEEPWPEKPNIKKRSFSSTQLELPKSTPDSNEKVREWQRNSEKETAFKIPKLNDRTFSPNDARNQTYKRRFSSPDVSGKLSEEDFEKNRPAEKYVNSIKICFKYRDTGYCSNSDCPYLHKEDPDKNFQIPDSSRKNSNIRHRSPFNSSRNMNMPPKAGRFPRPNINFGIIPPHLNKYNQHNGYLPPQALRNNDISEQGQLHMSPTIVVIPPPFNQNHTFQTPPPISTFRPPPSQLTRPSQVRPIKPPQQHQIRPNQPLQPRTVKSHPAMRTDNGSKPSPPHHAPPEQDNVVRGDDISMMELHAVKGKTSAPPQPSNSVLNILPNYVVTNTSNVNDVVTEKSKFNFNKIDESNFKDKAPSDLMNLFEDTDDIEGKWKIVQYFGDDSRGADFDLGQYVLILERMLMYLKDHSTERAFHIARRIATIKFQRNLIKKEDLLIMTEIESKAGNIPKVIELLTSYRSQYGKIINVESRLNKEVLLYHSIDAEARIVGFWDDFKDTALNSDRVLEQLLVTFPEKVLPDLFTPEDISQIHLRWLVSEGVVKVSAMTNFLSLVTKFVPNSVLEYIDKHHEKIIYVSKETAVKALELAPNMPNFTDCLNCLNALSSLAPQDIWSTDPLPALWNNILSYSYRKDLVQFGEQIYGVMENLKIKADVECSMMMLMGLCKNYLFDVFERRCQDLHKQNRFPSDFVFPSHFAEELSDVLTNYEGNDTNVLHHMVKFLLQSHFPPQEHRIQEVLNMLVAKRRFSDVYDLVMKCFETKIYLSQKDLRRAVYALEEWTHNLDASINVYQKMRHSYPRPEHQCVCGGQVRTHHPPARQPSSGELASPKSSIESNQDNTTMLSSGNESIESNTQRQTNLQLSRICAQLAASSRDISKFTAFYEEACNIHCANHDKVLVGLFLGLTEKDIKSDSFQQFVVQLLQKHDKLPFDVELAIARVGLRLVRYYNDQEMWRDAGDVVEVFHAYSISYANAGEGFGTQMETKDDLAHCNISELCTRTALYSKKLTLAPDVFSHVHHCVKYENLSSEDQELYISTASDIITGSFLEAPEKTVTFFTTVYKIFEDEICSDLFNTIIEKILNSKDTIRKEKAIELLADLETISANKINVYSHETIRKLVKFYSEINQMEDARKFFSEGREMGLYKETFFDSQPFSVEIKTETNAFEIYFIIESHLDHILRHRIFGIIGNTQRLSRALDLLVVPADGTDGDQFNMRLNETMRNIGRVLTKEFCPPLQILGTTSQKFTVCPGSIAQWHKHNISRKSLVNAQRKRSVVNIRDNQENELRIRFCPTPSHSSDTTQGPLASNACPPSNPSPHGQNSIPDIRFPDTNIPTCAHRYIRKTLCTYLTQEYKTKGGYFDDDDAKDTKFKTIAKELTDAFVAELQHHQGKLFFNDQIRQRILEYVDDYYRSQEDVTSQYGPDWGQRDAVINTDQPDNSDVFDSY